LQAAVKHAFRFEWTLNRSAVSRYRIGREETEVVENKVTGQSLHLYTVTGQSLYLYEDYVNIIVEFI